MKQVKIDQDECIVSRPAARQDIVDYIEMFYKSRCRHSSLGYMNPMEFENQML